MVLGVLNILLNLLLSCVMHVQYICGGAWNNLVSTAEEQVHVRPALALPQCQELVALIW